MALEPITRQEQIIAGKDLEPITRMEKFLKQYGGGGGAKHWNDIEGKPFGEELKSVELEFRPDTKLYKVSHPFGEFIVGQRYTVIFDGTEYTDLEVFDDEGVPRLGDSPEKELPFSIHTEGSTMYAIVSDDEQTHTIKVEGTAICHLNPLYLPPLGYCLRFVHMDGHIYDEHENEVTSLYAIWDKNALYNGKIMMLMDNSSDEVTWHLITSAKSSGRGYSIISCGNKTFYDNGHIEEQ